MNKSKDWSDIAPFQPPENAPQWFLDNLQEPGEPHFVAVNGDEIHLLAWNLKEESFPTLIFIHGFAGHAHWWSPLMPFFADQYRVVVVDLPGIGDSSHRAEYEIDCFAEAVLCVIQHYNLEPATIIGHSFGGIQAMIAMMLNPQAFRHGIVIDSNIYFPHQRPPGFVDPKKEHRRHSSRADCMERFVLTPPQPVVVDAMLQYAIYHSCARDNQGWHWKFDPKVRTTSEIKDPEMLTGIPIKVDCIYGQHSIYNKEELPQRARDCFSNFGELIIVPDAYHHVLLDHPLELVSTLRELINHT